MNAHLALVDAYGVSWDSHNTPRFLNPGATATVTITLTNTGSRSWAAGGPNPVHLAYHWRDTHGNLVVWNGRRTVLPADVPPGGSVTLTAQVQAPETDGCYTLEWDMVEEFVTWFSVQGVPPLSVPVTLTPPYGVAWIFHETPGQLPAGALTTVTLLITNVGSRTWTAGGSTPVHLGYHWRNAAGNLVVWNGRRTVLPANIPPCGSVTLNAVLEAPATKGSFTLQWDMVEETVTWFQFRGVIPLSVRVSLV